MYSVWEISRIHREIFPKRNESCDYWKNSDWQLQEQRWTDCFYDRDYRRVTGNRSE
nr:MAG TPA: hypothetical protein [Bacteriophage sp.]